MEVKNNPKLVGSDIIDCVPQTGKCPNGCLECFYNGKDWYRTRSKPLIPTVEETKGKVVRVNSGHDSNVQRDLVIKTALKYKNFFFNTSFPRFDFPGPVVFTCNGATAFINNDHTCSGFKVVSEEGLSLPDSKAMLIDEKFEYLDNVMFVRFRLNTWNEGLANKVVEHYTNLGIPVVMTFMRYMNRESIPREHRKFYRWQHHILNDHFILRGGIRTAMMLRWGKNKFVYSCGNGKSSYCKDCGNCTRFYYRWQLKQDEYGKCPACGSALIHTLVDWECDRCGWCSAGGDER